MKKPIVAITMGDAAGVGPELIVKALTKSAVRQRCRPLVVGDPTVMERAARIVESGLRFRAIASLGGARFDPACVDVLRPEGLELGAVVLGKLDPALGRAAALCMDRACELAMAGQIGGVVLAPMNKQAFHLAGYHYLDELEYLAEVTRSAETYLLGTVSPELWTVAVTTHLPFRAIPDLIRKERVLGYTKRLHDVLSRVGIEDPRIAVAALNVHAGEGGLFGREEIDEIGPAVGEARALGLSVEGPCPADTVFVRARAGEFHGVVCMYHDQANIARKLLATRRGATIYLGLPVVCATTAHGTAFDIAGRGIAETGSMEDALTYASLLAKEVRS